MRILSTKRADLLVAVVAVGLDTVLFTRVLEAQDIKGWSLFEAPIPLIVACGLIAIPALALRRRAPLAVCVGLAAYSGALTVLFGSRPLVMLLVAVYTAAAYRTLPRALVALGATLAAHSLSVVYELTSAVDSWQSVLALALLFTLLDTAAWSAGRWGARSRARERHLAETRAAMAAEAVNRERLRIARELHDIVAHSVTVMVLQSAGAAKVLDSDPVTARESMLAVQQMGRQAMAELRRLLDVLRTVSDGETTTAAEINQLAMLPELTRSVEAAGVRVHVTVEGLAGVLDPSVDSAAYRVIQESLTNTTRYAGPGTAAVVALSWGDGELHISVSDDGAGTPMVEAAALSSGFGTLGLRERVSLIGGQFESGPHLGGGYRTLATLPAGPA